MAVIVKNIGATVPADRNNVDTKKSAVNASSTVRAIYQGQEYTFGPNEARTFQDDGIGYGVAAFNSNLTAYPQDYWK